MERRGSRIRPSRNDKIEGEKGKRRRPSARGRRRARTAVVNGNNCCGRCHSKARVPNARCQTVVRVITVITSYRDIHAVCVHQRDRGNDLAFAFASTATHRDRPIRNRFSRLESSGRGKCSDDREEEEGTGGERVPVLEDEEDGRKVPKWSTPRWRFSQVPRFFPSSLLETDAYRETDKRRRGLMILRRRLGRIMRDLRQDELEPVFPTCGPRA